MFLDMGLCTLTPIFSASQGQNEKFQWARARVYLHEATVRMMAGAAPGKTQQLLDKSLIQRNSARGLICIKGKFVFTYSLYYGYKNVTITIFVWSIQVQAYMLLTV